MLPKEFEFLAFDAQYILYRNFAALKSRVKFPCSAVLAEEEGDNTINYIIDKFDITAQSLIKQFFWSIAKIVREDYGVNKILLLWDTGPYIKCRWLPDYKGSRTHYSQQLLDEYDIQNDPQGYLQAKEDVRVHNIFLEAKSWIQLNLNKLGMVSVWHPGYEADDLAYIFSTIVDDRSSEMKSAICSADSDWQYWITKNTEWINFNTKEHWSYDDICEKNLNWTDKLGIDLFELKKWKDSLMGSHNDIEYTSAIYSFNELDIIYNEVQNGIYDNITDRTHLENNLKTFDIFNYEDIDIVRNKIKRALVEGSLGDDNIIEMFFREGFQVSESYIKTYQEQLNRVYYNMDLSN